MISYLSRWATVLDLYDKVLAAGGLQRLPLWEQARDCSHIAHSQFQLTPVELLQDRADASAKPVAVH